MTQTPPRLCSELNPFSKFSKCINTHTHKPWMLQQKRHKKTRTHPLLFIFLCSPELPTFHHPRPTSSCLSWTRVYWAQRLTSIHEFHILPNHKLCNHVYCDRRVLHNLAQDAQNNILCCKLLRGIKSICTFFSTRGWCNSLPSSCSCRILTARFWFVFIE